jgi:transketolase C-terminal domain/subunit
MGNDDITIFDGLAHLKIIDVSCPQQLLSIMRWIMDGNRGLVYVRVMRTGSAVLYPADYEFEFGRGCTLRQTDTDSAILISSGRGVHEAIAAATQCATHNLNVSVVDMPSIDENLLLNLHDSGKPIFLAEQNNGYIWQNLLKILHRRRANAAGLDRIHTINTLSTDGKPHFIHSATYEELGEVYGLSATKLAHAITEKLERLQ